MKTKLDTGITVGEVKSVRPHIEPVKRRLIRIDLSTTNSAEELVRETLNRITAVEMVDDHLGVDYEAVPFEDITVVGSDFLADNLIRQLPRYFQPLSYRRLSFNVDRVPSSDGRVSVLFGTLIDARRATYCGTLRWISSDGKTSSLPVPADALSSNVQRWMIGQSSAVFGLGTDPGGEGLPKLLPGVPKDGYALAIEPGSRRPRMRLLSFNPRGDANNDRAFAALAEGTEFDVSIVDEEGRYDAKHPDLDGHIRLVPDSAFSRPVQAPSRIHAMLKICGLFLPQPYEGARDIEALAVSFTSEKLLRCDGLRQAEAEVCIVGGRERTVRWSTGRVDQIGLKNEISELGLRIVRPAELRIEGGVVAGPRREIALIANGDGPIGWIRLRLGDLDRRGNETVMSAELRYMRQRWISQNGIFPEERAIYLDWLDNAVRLICSDRDGGARTQGLATYLSGRRGGLDTPETLIHSENAILMRRRGDTVTRAIGNGALFRFGPLLVKLVLPEHRF